MLEIHCRRHVPSQTTNLGGLRDPQDLNHHGIHSKKIHSKESKEGLGRVWRTWGLPELKKIVTSHQGIHAGMPENTQTMVRSRDRQDK